jgi:hypothetical protein
MATRKKRRPTRINSILVGAFVFSRLFLLMLNVEKTAIDYVTAVLAGANLGWLAGDLLIWIRKKRAKSD